MISKENYKIMKQKYGHISSWAIWTPAGDKPKSNTEDMSWVSDPDLLDKLDTGYIFVGLNWSSTHGDFSKGGTISWTNFHSGYSRQNDYKLRYAFTDTIYWGSYITDFVKLYAEVDSAKVSAYLRKNPDVIKKNTEDFKEEISYLKKDPVLVAMGDKAYQLLNDNLSGEYKITKIKHYSFTIGKEDYRKEVLEILS